jgi:hypothetical protein
LNAFLSQSDEGRGQASQWRVSVELSQGSVIDPRLGFRAKLQHKRDLPDRNLAAVNELRTAMLACRSRVASIAMAVLFVFIMTSAQRPADGRRAGLKIRCVNQHG